MYLGICNNFVCNNNIDDLTFVSFKDNFKDGKIKKSFGAHAFMINKLVTPLILTRINNIVLQNQPFDLSCLGYLQKIYPDECFVFFVIFY